ncbi:MAG TPA: caspase family protein [Albitalea sp.]|uniref:caspase family protein n=1 Tax=Piscinibacter sp. TaxID=1903157 RepID=UPI002ED373CF
MQRRHLCAGLLAGVTFPGWAATASLAGGSPDDRKAALVIGNSAYKVGSLKNPVNDAQAVAGSLRTLGFDVALRENTSLRDMLEAFRQFSVSAKTAKVRVLFYAGHGVQVKGRNYLLPVDTEIRAEDEVPAKSADLNELLDRLGSMQQGINIVILDACRNNPFSGAEIVGPDGRRLKFRGATPAGLAPVEAPLGSMVAFSTAPGGVALDNPGEKNSLYTKHLLSFMQSPGLPVELLFKQVRLSVARDTGRVQVPWESSSLTGDFCFRQGPQGGCSSGR